jgi:hypothetical protein
MQLNFGKHKVDEINGVRCTIVEDNISQERVNFLKELLEFNKYEIQVAEKPVEGDAPKTYTIGVTDIIFNPVIAVYQRLLKTPKGNKVTPAYWNQQTDKCDPNYWNFDHMQKEDENLFITYSSV